MVGGGDVVVVISEVVVIAGGVVLVVGAVVEVAVEKVVEVDWVGVVGGGVTVPVVFTTVSVDGLVVCVVWTPAWVVVSLVETGVVMKDVFDDGLQPLRKFKNPKLIIPPMVIKMLLLLSGSASWSASICSIICSIRSGFEERPAFGSPMQLIVFTLPIINDVDNRAHID